MTDIGESTDINSLPDADIQRLIEGNQHVAQEFGQQAKTLREELGPLEQSVRLMQREHSSLVLKAQVAQTQVRELQKLLTQRQVEARQTEVVDAFAKRLQQDAERASKSPTLIARGFSRVLSTIAQGEDHRKGLLDLVNMDLLAPEHKLSRRINVYKENGDNAFIKMHADGGHIVGYHIKDQTPDTVRSAVASIHAVGVEDPYAKSYSLRVSPHFIGLTIDMQEDNSVAVFPVVLLQGQRRDASEHRILPQAKTLAQPIADFVGTLFLVGSVSLPNPQQTRR